MAHRSSIWAGSAGLTTVLTTTVTTVGISTTPTTAQECAYCAWSRAPPCPGSVGVKRSATGHRLFIDNERELAGIAEFEPGSLRNEYHWGTREYRHRVLITKNGRLRIRWSRVRAPPAPRQRLFFKIILVQSPFIHRLCGWCSRADRLPAGGRPASHPCGSARSTLRSIAPARAAVRSLNARGVSHRASWKPSDVLPPLRRPKFDRERPDLHSWVGEDCETVEGLDCDAIVLIDPSVSDRDPVTTNFVASQMHHLEHVGRLASSSCDRPCELFQHYLRYPTVGVLVGPPRGPQKLARSRVRLAWSAGAIDPQMRCRRCRSLAANRRRCRLPVD